MRKTIFIFFVLLGAGAGLLASLNGDIGLQVVMAMVGVVAGAAVGGALTRIGKRSRHLQQNADALRGLGVTHEDLATNYWRDKGHPPFMKPPSPENGSRMFEDRLD